MFVKYMYKEKGTNKLSQKTPFPKVWNQIPTLFLSPEIYTVKLHCKAFHFLDFIPFFPKDYWIKFSLIVLISIWIFMMVFLFVWVGFLVRFLVCLGLVFFFGGGGFFLFFIVLWIVLRSKCCAMPNAEDRATADEKYNLALWQSTMGSDKKQPFDSGCYNFLWLSLFHCKLDYFFSAKEPFCQHSHSLVKWKQVWVYGYFSPQ